jgi:hypothetical protein
MAIVLKFDVDLILVVHGSFKESISVVGVGVQVLLNTIIFVITYNKQYEWASNQTYLTLISILN